MVKSVSKLEDPLLSLRLQVQASRFYEHNAAEILHVNHIPSALFPHAQVLVGILFSSAALLQSVKHC